MLKLDDLSRLKGHRFLRTVTGYAVCAYHRFALNLRDVEDLLAEREIIVSHETIRVWGAKFGAQTAAKTRRDRSEPADRWHLDEVVLKTNGAKHWLWRAVDAKGEVWDILVQSRRNAAAAKRFMHELFKRWGLPRVMVTDKLGSHSAAKAKRTAGTRGSIARRKHRIGILADEGRSWAGSSHRDKPSVSWRSTIKQPPSSARTAELSA